MTRGKLLTIVAVAAAVVVFSGVASAGEFKLNLGGTTYTKWLWGTERYDGAMYNYTTIPGEGYGDNGQGTEIELLLDAKVSRKVEVKARLHSRFSQNEWTNTGGWGNPKGDNPVKNGDCWGGNCGEFDPRSNQYVKLRGVAVVFTPGYKWLDSATIGANDWGMFDPVVVGRIRYIDRDNVSGLLFQGSAGKRSLTWDAARISLPRLWAGPGWSTGTYAAADGLYVTQFRYAPSSLVDVGGIFQYTNDVEIDPADNYWDNGRAVRTRLRNEVGGIKVGIHPSPVFDIRGQYYRSSVASNKLGIPIGDVPTSFGLNGYSPVVAGVQQDNLWKANLDLNDPFGMGLSFFMEGFSIGARYTSIMASRREADVLMTEGYDATWFFPGPNNASYGIWGGNWTRMGIGGWDGNAQQVATLNVDNDFADFDEPLAETAIGWKGFTFVPVYSNGPLEVSAEYTKLGYNTNWQAWGRPNNSITDTIYPAAELDAGVLHNFRSAYAPFQDKSTTISLLKGKYTIQAGKGVDVFWKLKWISETDNRMNQAMYLPFKAGDCSYTGPCKDQKNEYSKGNSTGDYYGNPAWITVKNPVTGKETSGYQWKPFDSLSDDDRDLSYRTYQIGLGYQLTDDLYGSLGFNYFKAKVKDGNTALQAYNLHEMVSGDHTKNQLVAKARYVMGGAEVGFEYQYTYGTFTPDFGGGFVVQYADAGTSSSVHVPVNSPGFKGRYGGWNSLLERQFTQQRIKAFLKVQF